MSMNSSGTSNLTSAQAKDRAIRRRFAKLQRAKDSWLRRLCTSVDWEEATRDEVRERISAFVIKHGSSQDRPPATETELVVMALLVADEDQTVENIINWIFDSFGYHKLLARSALSHFGKTDHRLIRDLQHQILSSFSRFEVRIDVRYCVGQDRRCSISAKEGDRFLANVLETLEPKRVGVRLFPFFKLPPELRHQIYKMVFQYPQAGICPDFPNNNDAGCQPGSLKLCTRYYDAPVRFERWSKSYCSQHQWQSLVPGVAVRTAPVKDILAPLLLSKQFHHEALPVFYGVNHFHFPNLRLLVATITALRIYAPEHLQYIRHVSVAFSMADFFRTGAAKQFIHLGRFTGLKKLEFVLDEEHYKDRMPIACLDDPQPKDFQGLTTLKRAAKAGEFVFHDCPTLERMLKMDTTKLRAKKVVAGVGMGGEKQGATENGAA